MLEESLFRVKGLFLWPTHKNAHPGRAIPALPGSFWPPWLFPWPKDARSVAEQAVLVPAHPASPPTGGIAEQTARPPFEGLTTKFPSRVAGPFVPA